MGLQNLPLKNQCSGDFSEQCQHNISILNPLSQIFVRSECESHPSFTVWPWAGRSHILGHAARLLTLPKAQGHWSCCGDGSPFPQPLTFPSSLKLTKARRDQVTCPKVHGCPVCLLVCVSSALLTGVEVVDIGNPGQMWGGWREGWACIDS